MSEVTESALLAPRAHPEPAEVVAVVGASGRVTPELLEFCRLFILAREGLAESRAATVEFGEHRGWHRERIERALQIVKAGASFHDLADKLLDDIRARLPTTSLKNAWWQ